MILAIDKQHPRYVHGEAHKTPEYRAWKKMRERCLCVTSKDYPAYGGRGISICADWERYPTFLRDVGRRPTPNHSLGRKDNNGSYCRNNCEWQSAQRQARNRRSSRMLSFKGMTMSMPDWSELLGIRYSTLLCRVSGHGWSAERALTTEPRRWPRRRTE